MADSRRNVNGRLFHHVELLLAEQLRTCSVVRPQRAHGRALSAERSVDSAHDRAA